MTERDPYHEGEIAVQERAGERALASRHGRLIGDRIMAGALPFIASQRMVVVGSVAASGHVWASVLFGARDFIAAQEHGIAIDLAMSSRREGDPLWCNLAEDPRVGMLFIELATRRRVRVNGEASLPDPDRMHVTVTESYPNCSRFITRRELPTISPAGLRGGGAHLGGAGLEPVVRAIVPRADTLFVATAHAERGVDLSHRGGPAGFVKVRANGSLRIPDYAGNGMFNTLGNLSVDPRAGLLLLDFQRGDLVQLTGRAEIRWDEEDPSGETGGTHRFWDFTPEQGIVSERAAPSGWQSLDP